MRKEVIQNDPHNKSSMGYLECFDQSLLHDQVPHMFFNNLLKVCIGFCGGVLIMGLWERKALHCRVVYNVRSFFRKVLFCLQTKQTSLSFPTTKHDIFFLTNFVSNTNHSGRSEKESVNKSAHPAGRNTKNKQKCCLIPEDSQITFGQQYIFHDLLLPFVLKSVSYRRVFNQNL